MKVLKLLDYMIWLSENDLELWERNLEKLEEFNEVQSDEN